MNDVIMMLVGLYSNVWLRLIIISTEVLEGLTYKFGVESLALTETCPDIKFHIYWYHSYCLQEEEEKHGQNGTIIFEHNFHIWYFFTEICITRYGSTLYIGIA